MAKVVEICPYCGHVLGIGKDMHYPNTIRLFCTNCNKDFHEDTNDFEFKPFNPGRKYKLNDGTDVDLRGKK